MEDRSTRTPNGQKIAPFLIAAAVALTAAPAVANEIAELKAQIEALQQRLAEIEAAQKDAEKKAVTAGETGGWKLPGSDTSVSISGYVRGLQRKVDIYSRAPYIPSVGRETWNGEKGTRKSAPRGNDHRAIDGNVPDRGSRD